MAFDGRYDQSLSRTAMKAELLDAETELALAYAWRDHRDEKALHRLITAYMRLAISMASKFKRYGNLTLTAAFAFLRMLFGGSRHRFRIM